MNTIEEIREKNSGVVTAGIYISCNNAVVDEKLISEQLSSILEFAETNEIIVVDSYIDRESRENYNRLTKDCREYIFDVVLVYNNTLSGLENVIVIDIASQN